MPIRSRMSSITGQIELEHPELFALEFGKIAEYDFVYTLSSTNIDQSVPNLVKMYVIIRSRISLIIDLIEPELSDLFALEFAKIAESDVVNALESTNVDQLVPNMVTININYESNRDRMVRVICPLSKRLLYLTLFTLYHLHI